MPPSVHATLLPRLSQVVTTCSLGFSHASKCAPIASFRRLPASAVRLRGYATHHNSGASSLLSQALDQKQRASEHDVRESIGPIPLGMARPSLRAGEKVKKWSELSTGGKFVRATARTTNLTVILLGAGLTAVLGYALTSELFSNNSPTVLYGQACEKIKASPKVAKYLHGPLKFHNNPPSLVRPRHRNQHVSSQIAVDSAGREHMFLTFYIEGSVPSSNTPVDPDAGYLAVIEAKTSALSAMSWDDLSDAVKARADRAAESAKSAVRYLVGKPVPSVVGVKTGAAEEEKPEEKKGVWSFAGMFSGLRGAGSGAGASSADAERMAWAEGEVHAELIRNDDGYFVFRYLVVDIPNSRTRNPTRVFVERAPGVSEYEPVISWRS